MNNNLNKFNQPYNSQEVEEKIYKLWEEGGFFNPDNLPVNKIENLKLKIKNFCVIMPPPNANGSLHLGHALMAALEDIMIRYKRMRGFKTLWLPGADHAGFETQVVYQKKLEKEGRNWFQIPREQLWKEIWDFTQQNKGIMENQLKKLGASCDWSRKKFTLDDDIISKTQDTFIQMHKKGLVYRGNRLVNWCIKHRTTLSDLEINHEEKETKLYFIKYKIVKSNDYIVVATTRPETIPADVAIAINPKSKKWKKFLNKTAINPANGNYLPIIEDSSVDESFGTGALKITPYHDHVDYEIYQKHKNKIDEWLNGKPISVILYNNGTILGNVNLGKLSPVAGLKIREALEKSVELLRNDFEKEPENYVNKVAVCYKCNNKIEPRLMPQWFIKMKPLAKPAIEAVEKGKIKIIPGRFKKVYLHWLKNIRDWNISRQIVWGIRIPAWYHEPKCVLQAGHEKETVKCKDIIVSMEKPRCEFCDAEFIQDTDVFDTWFSSGQWPSLVLGYSDSSKSKVKSKKSKLTDYEEFYPTDVMETGWDILFFWVARMVMLGIYKTGEIPFKHIYLHGLVRDKDKQKMSKSKGNVVDPLGVVNEYGADALRMALIVGNTPGNDPVFSEDKVRGYRNFANKIWQASRFVLMNLEDFDFNKKPALSAGDKKRLKEFETLKKKITKQMDKFKFYQAAEEIYHYFWHTFADKIIEENKEALKGNDVKKKQAAQYVLFEILSGCLKLLHPFMPFITEEIYQNLPSKNTDFLMIDKWD